jgi:hypothetical protein
VNRSRRRLVTVVVAAVVLALVAVAIGTRGHLWGKPKEPANAAAAPAAPSKQDLGGGVSLVGANAPTGLHAKLASGHVNASRQVAKRVSRTFDVEPSGPLSRPLTLEFPLNEKVPVDSRTIVFTSESAKGPWTPLRTTVTSDGLHVRVVVKHLTRFEALFVDVEGAFEVLKQTLHDLTGHIAEDAQAPECSHHDQAVESGYSASASGADSILWCLGMDEGKGALRTVNNRRYPLLVYPKGLDDLSRGSNDTFARWVARRISFNGTVIYPRDDAVFGAELPRGKSASLEVTFGQQAQLLSSLDIGVKSVFTIITKFGAADMPNRILRVTGKLLTADSCAHSKSTTEMIGNCLSAKQIIEAAGTWGLVLAPILTVSGLVEYFHGVINGIGDQFSGRTYAEVTLKRARDEPTRVRLTATSVAGVSFGTPGGRAEALLTKRLGKPDETFDGGCEITGVKSRWLRWGGLSVVLTSSPGAAQELTTWILRSSPSSRPPVDSPYGLGPGTPMMTVLKTVPGATGSWDSTLNLYRTTDGRHEIQWTSDRPDGHGPVTEVSSGSDLLLCE